MSCRPIVWVLLFAAIVPTSLVAQQTDEERDADRGYYYTGFDITDTDVGELVEWLEYFNLPLPFSIEGQATAQLTAGVPFYALREARAYRFNGVLTSGSLKIAGVELRDIRVGIDYYEGDLRLRNLRFQLPATGEEPGTLTGVATMGLVPSGQLKAHFEMDSAPLAALAALVPDVPLDLGGSASGEVTADAPVEQITDLATWRATAKLSLPRATAAGRVLENGSAEFTLSQGVATLGSLSARVAGVPIQGNGTLGITAPYPMTLAISVPEGRLERIGDLVPEVPLPADSEGPYSLTANATGTLSPLNYQAQAELKAGPATVVGASLESLTLAMQLTPERVAIPSLQAVLAGGTVQGTAELAWEGQEPGTAELSWRNLRLSGLAGPETLGPFDGELFGSASLTVPPGAVTDLQQWTAQGKIELPRLGTETRKAGELQGEFAFQQGELDYNLTGELFGGRLTVREVPPEEVPAPAENVEVPDVQLDGAMSEVQLQGFDLGVLTSFFDRRRQPIVTGTVDLNATVGWDETPTARGGVTVQSLRFGNILLAENLRGRLQFSENRLQLVNVAGSYGGGSLEGSADVRFTPEPRASFLMSLSGATVDRAFPWMPAISETLSGQIDLRLRGEYRRDLRAVGIATLSRGEALGIRFGTARFPVRLVYGLRSGRGELRVERTSVGLSGGQARLQAVLGLNGGTDVDAEVDFNRVRIGPVLQQTAGAGFLADGPAQGRLVITGRNVRSENDLRGTLRAELGSVQASNSPLARAVGPLLGSVGGRPGVFQEGLIRADLANGVWRISELSLTGRQAELFASGTVTLAGRLNLQIVAASLSVDQCTEVLETILLFVPVAGPIPLGVLTDIADVLEDRSIALSVRGTLQRPRVQVRPLETITLEAIRYLVRKGALNSL